MWRTINISRNNLLFLSKQYNVQKSIKFTDKKFEITRGSFLWCLYIGNINYSLYKRDDKEEIKLYNRHKKRVSESYSYKIYIDILDSEIRNEEIKFKPIEVYLRWKKINKIDITYMNLKKAWRVIFHSKKKEKTKDEIFEEADFWFNHLIEEQINERFMDYMYIFEKDGLSKAVLGFMASYNFSNSQNQKEYFLGIWRRNKEEYHKKELQKLNKFDESESF